MSRRASIALFLVAITLLLFAHFAEAQVNHETLHERDDLIGTSWWVEDIDGKGVVDRSRTTVAFPEPGKVLGSSGCNRYAGSAEFNGETLGFGPLAGTRRACPEALMFQETRFYGAMDEVRSWWIDPDTGLLHLRNEAGDTVLRAVHLEEGDEA